MLEFACKDLGLKCSYVAKGSTVAEIKKLATDHANNVHPDMLKGMTPAQLVQLDQSIEAKIKTV